MSNQFDGKIYRAGQSNPFRNASVRWYRNHCRAKDGDHACSAPTHPHPTDVHIAVGAGDLIVHVWNNDDEPVIGVR